ncbi:hypothetical protein F511_14855 [Dorcoceras hygrometricum]|uniref:Uncharacterized protein n=1 Tax=Dorcoceras hygrometricum TaxID=472368 RepID=A0A2Z7D556_9LAMI|nr:hypothetical protein F511_14855 [Dorcoceras hygrometricum]
MSTINTSDLFQLTPSSSLLFITCTQETSEPRGSASKSGITKAGNASITITLSVQ